MKFDNNIVKVTNESAMPTGKHYAIVTYVTLLDADDEGVDVPVYTSYTDRDTWELAIRSLAASKRSFNALVVTPAKVRTTTVITTDISVD